MNRFIFHIALSGVLVLFTIGFFGCASTGSTQGVASSSSNSKVEVTNPNIDLTDYLKRIPGVQVSGSGSNASITVRGVNTFRGNPSPLFVLNGIRLGRNYQTVYGQVNMHDVSNVEVLKGSDASAYGVDGGTGVVLIEYKD